MTVLLNNHPQDFIEAMNWETSHVQQKSIQHSIPFEEESLSENSRLSSMHSVIEEV